MLVLLGPRYSGTDAELDVLSATTGLARYDLRTRLRPGAWSVVRAVADSVQAGALASRLRGEGLQSCALDSSVGQDTARRIVYLRGIEIGIGNVVLKMAERDMTIPQAAILTIVRGDVHLGRLPLSASIPGFSPSVRANIGAPTLLSPSAPMSEVFREQRAASNHEVFVAADIHFVTVSWLARIDPRDCAFAGSGPSEANHAERLDRFIDDLAAELHVRVDRHVKTSSLASHTAGTQRLATPSSNGPSSSRRGAAAADEHFDAYSRLVGEAERQTYLADESTHTISQ